MRSINDYSEYLAVLKDKSSKDPSVRNEANRALEKLQLSDPGRYTLYRTLDGEIEPPEEVAPLTPKKKRKVYDKEQYISEHPEINIEELRRKARERILKGPYGLGLRFELPSWITERELLSSLEVLTVSDLITGTGSLAQRSILYRKCVKQAAASGRIDEEKLRQTILNRCRSLWNSETFTNHPDYSFEAVKWLILKVASVEELADADIDGSINYFKLFGLIFDKRIKKLNVEELEELKAKNEEFKAKKEAQKQAKKSRNAIKKAKRKAEKEAALKKAMEEKEVNSSNNQVGSEIQ